MSDERVRVDRDGAGATVWLTRAEKRNGLDIAMFEQLVAAGRSLAEDRTLRAVVLAGEGAAFCAGLDFQSFMTTPNAPQILLEREGVANLAQEVGWVWRELPVPVIAAIHGPCFGGGLQIALGADIRLAHPEARLSVMEIRWGLIPDMGITQTLLPLVRPDVARELTYTGRRVSGTEALALGLVTRVVDDPQAEAKALADTIATKSPHAIRAAKALFERAPALGVAEGLALETELQLPLLGSKNQLEAVQANMQKRAPVFDDVD